MTRFVTAACTGLFLITSAGAASAHHSGAMFDNTRKVVLQGTVKSFEWTNPHSRIWIVASTVDGKPTGVPQLWAVESGSPGNLTRQGWSKRTLNPGDTVTLPISPMRSGVHAGLAATPTLVNGKPFAGARKPKAETEKPNLD